MDSVKKKILFIITQSEFGGAQRFIFELVSRLDRNKYDILVAAGEGDNELFNKLRDTSAKAVHLEKMRRNPSPFRTIESVSEILDLLRKEKPDTLFLCSTTAGLLGSVASSLHKNKEMKTIYRIGGWAFNDPRPLWQNQAIAVLEKLTARFKDKIIVNSEFDRRSALKRNICPAGKITKIHNGIDPESLQFLPKQEARRLLLESSQDSELVVGAVANFYKTKGLNHLIEAMKLAESQYGALNVKCAVIGDGRERPGLESLIRKHGLEKRIVLAGRIKDAYRYLKAFDIFTLPSLKEGFPWIILEAMAAQIPIIATEVGALPEIIRNNEHGLLITPGSAKELARGIIKLAENPELGKKFSANAKLRLKEFSALKMVKETEKLLQ